MIQLKKQKPKEKCRKLVIECPNRTNEKSPSKMQSLLGTHKIYITLDDDKMYQILSDFSKIEVNKVDILTGNFKRENGENDIIILHKWQFEQIKDHLLNKNSVNRMDEDAALFFCKIGFLTEGELNKFLVESKVI